MDTSNKENIYFLGLLWADGCVRKDKKGYFYTSYESNLQDFNEIKPILKKIGHGCFQERQRTNQNKAFGKRQGSFSTGKQDFSRWLYEQGYNNKSYIAPTKILASIQKNFHYLFWRGYFDGDGCLYLGSKQELAFWSTINQDWSEMQRLFSNLLMKTPSIYKYKRKNNTQCSSVIRTGHSNSIKLFLDYIYQDNIDIGFSRKYEKYLDFLKKYPKIQENKRKTSVIKGVCFNKRNNKWKASIQKNKTNKLIKSIHLGWFKEEKEAINAIKSFKC